MKSLVLNEQLATGVVRFELFGDQDQCRKFLHHGRKQLGSMRVMYGVNQRISDNGGEGGGFFHQWGQAKHTDGSRAVLHTITNDGQDTVRIYAQAGPPKPEAPPLDSMFRVKGVRIVGYCNSPDGDRAALWIEGRAIFLGLPDADANGFQHSRAEDISDDGSTVVGTGSTGWYWTQVTGIVTLPDAPNSYGGAGQAFGVSADGRFISGIGQFDFGSGVGSRNWVFDRHAGTYELLPDRVADAVRISADALWACGGTTIWSRQDTRSAWSVYAVMPSPGTKTNTSTGPGQTPQSYVDDAYVMTDIATGGYACGNDGHQEMGTWDEYTTMYDPVIVAGFEAGVRTLTNQTYYGLEPADNDVIVYVKGALLHRASGATVRQIAGDTKDRMIVGGFGEDAFSSTTTITPAVSGPIASGEVVVEEVNFPSGSIPHGCYVDDGGMRDLGPYTRANGVSDDGILIVGATISTADTNPPSPVYWRHNNGAVTGAFALPLLDGCDRGEAVSVTRKAGGVKLLNPGIPPSDPPFDTAPPEDMPASVEATILKD